MQANQEALARAEVPAADVVERVGGVRDRLPARVVVVVDQDVSLVRPYQTDARDPEAQVVLLLELLGREAAPNLTLSEVGAARRV